MGNTSSTSDRNEGRREGGVLLGRTRSALSAFRRRVRSSTSYAASQFERQFNFQRLMGENFQTDNASQRRSAQHLVTLSLSYTQDQNECTIFISGRDSSWEKILEATIVEDLTGDYPTEGFLTIISNSGRSSTKFESPHSATYIKSVFQNILSQASSE